MQQQFILDFDGVLFNSAFEAYTVANKCTEGREGFRRDITYEEFLEYRAVVTDAWQYFRLYSEGHYIPPSSLIGIKPTEDDWEFARSFFEARKVMMGQTRK